MPRKRDPTKKAHRRSHGGCQRCRLHKIRCDETKPRCGPCTSRGYSDCTFSLVLKWEDDYRFIGRAFGRAGVWSKTSSSSRSEERTKQPSPHNSQTGPMRVPHVHQSGFLNLFTYDFETEDDPEASLLTISHNDSYSPTAISSQSAVANPEMTRRLKDPLRDNLQLVDPHLLTYFLHQICPLTVPGPNYAAGSPFSAGLFPFALSSSSTALMHALVGLAASHRARFDNSFRGVALNYSRNALRSLRLSLATKSAVEVAVDPEVLVLMMLLCQTELIGHSNSSWLIHVRGARDFVSFRNRQQQLNPKELVALDRRQQHAWEQAVVFAERFFAFCDVIGRTACREEPIFGPEFWTTQEDEVDLWMGCSPHLVNVVSTITELSWKHHRQPPSDEEQQEVKNQRNQLHRLLQQPNFRWGPADTSIDGILRHCVELKRLTVELYLDAALSNTTPFSPSIKERVVGILRKVSILLQLDVKSGLTWPLFMAGCQLDPKEDLKWADGDGFNVEIPQYARPFILYALDHLSGSLFDVSRTRVVIETVWKRRELACFFNPEHPHSPLPRGINDWTHFVAPLCHNLSLA
ncbi:Fc.00g033660.m01.CDS01 [Cosmosporella sp. VM-42]